MVKTKQSKVEQKSALRAVPASATQIVNELKELTAASIELRRRVPSVRALSKDDRQASSGKFRFGEAAVLEKVLDLVDARPALFSVLASRDGGANPNVVETTAARDALARKVAADEAVAAAELYVKALRDYALVAGEEVRELTAPAYAIIRTNAKVDAELRDAAAVPMAFYRDASRAKGSKPKG
jgi:hypothetical protein